MSNSNTASTDGLIIGAGPTGLALACELARRGFHARLFDQLPSFQTQSRALGIQSRTLEIFEKMGIIDSFLAKGKIVKKGNFYHNGKCISSFQFTHIKEVAYPFILILPQVETEKILIDHYHKLGGSIERQMQLIKLSGSQATFQKSDHSEEAITAPWIFGCDGAHSRVRHALELPFEGTQFPETFALADVQLTPFLSPDEVHLFISKGQITGLIPLPELNHFRLVSVMPTSYKNTELDISFFQDRLTTCCQLQNIQIRSANWMTCFTVHRRIVPHMRVGNVFLLGDASHIHSPAGGQGMNTSIQDAYNLAWKLALVHQEKAHPSLLNSFEKERLPIALKVLKGTTHVTRMITSRFFKQFLFPFIGPIAKRAFFQRRLFKLISELNLTYSPSDIIAEPRSEKNWIAPMIGSRAPDVLYLPNDARLFDYFSPLHHTLLCFGGKEWQPLIDAVDKAIPKQFIAYYVSSTQTGDGIIYDPIKAIADAYQGHFPCLFVIRPDGVIGYRTRSSNPAPLLAYLSRLFKIAT